MEKNRSGIERQPPAVRACARKSRKDDDDIERLYFLSCNLGLGGRGKQCPSVGINVWYLKRLNWNERREPSYLEPSPSWSCAKGLF